MIISVVNEKGGSGKSTLATNIAIYESIKQNKNNLWLVDSDPQKSIATFLSIRQSENLDKIFNFTYKTGEDLKKFINSYKNELVIIDTGGRDSKEMRIAIGLSDIIIIPTIPSQFDICVLDLMIDRVKTAKEFNDNLKAYIVINKASTNPFLNKKIDNLKEYIRELESDYIFLCDSVIYEREKYKIATTLGKGVTELEKSKASDEIEHLCNEIFNRKEKNDKVQKS